MNEYLEAFVHIAKITAGIAVGIFGGWVMTLMLNMFFELINLNDLL